MVGSEMVFRGEQVSSVLEQVKIALGEDANILSIKHLSKGAGVEVTASEGIKVDSESESSTSKQKTNTLESKSSYSYINEAELLNWIENFGCSNLFKSNFQTSLDGLDRSDLINTCDVALRTLINIDNCVTFKSRFAALLGGAGSGKSTLCFKLAAKLATDCGMKVGILHLSNSLLPNILNDYSRFNIPVVAYNLDEVTPKSLAQSLDEFRHSELVLIDLPNLDDLQEPAATKGFNLLLSLLENPELIWTLDARSNLLSNERALQGVLNWGVPKVVLTHVDGSATLGSALSVLNKNQLNLSFISTGKNIPNDVEPATYSRLSWWVAMQINELKLIAY